MRTDRANSCIILETCTKVSGKEIVQMDTESIDQRTGRCIKEAGSTTSKKDKVWSSGQMDPLSKELTIKDPKSVTEFINGLTDRYTKEIGKIIVYLE